MRNIKNRLTIKDRKAIMVASDAATRNCRDNAKHGGQFSGGLAFEGYDAGYAAALADVMLFLSGCYPCVRPTFWEVRS